MCQLYKDDYKNRAAGKPQEKINFISSETGQGESSTSGGSSATGSWVYWRIVEIDIVYKRWYVAQVTINMKWQIFWRSWCEAFIFYLFLDTNKEIFLLDFLQWLWVTKLTSLLSYKVLRFSNTVVNLATAYLETSESK